MAATITPNKNLRTIIAAGTSNAAGGTTTGTVVNLTNAAGPHLLTLKITNGGTGPAVGAKFNVYTSGDNTNFKLYAVYQTVDLTAGAVAEWPVPVEAGTMYVRADCTGNTGQAVTCEAFLQELTSYSSA